MNLNRIECLVVIVLLLSACTTISKPGEDENIYETIQQSFSKNCYVWKTGEGWNATSEPIWDNFLNVKCNDIQDCIDFYISIGATDKEVRDLIRKDFLRCEKEPSKY